MGYWDDFRSGARAGGIFGAAIVGLFVAIIEVAKRLITNPPFSSPAKRELKETITLYQEVKAAFDASPFCDPEAADDFMFDIVQEAGQRAGAKPSLDLLNALFETVRGLLVDEGSLFGWHEVDFSKELEFEEGVRLRNYLRRKKRFLADHERLADIWREKVIWIFTGLIDYLPPSVFSDDNEREEEDDENQAATLTAPLIDLCETPAEVIERTLATIFDDDVVNARLFEPIRDRLEQNILAASGIPLEKRYEANKNLVLPTAARKQSPTELIDTYLAGTPFAELLATTFPFTIPFPVRFEHTHIVGGTGHGKTQLLQLLIHHDLMRAREDGRSIIVIDSQGDLISTISHLDCFNPAAEKSLADKLVIIDPNDVEYPVCLNMFDFNRDRLEQYRPVDREKILNGTIELYEYLFGALLGAELTQRQGLIFRYLARLMLEIPNATVHTLRELMEDGEPFRPYMQKLPGTARSFFETRFFDRSFNQTKKQILTRLWGVLSNTTFDRMFSNPRNKVDMFEATNSGKIILINTAKELLKQEGCVIFGRFFVALIAQAALERAALSPHERRPTFLYIDEAQDYFDENIEHLLNQARKYRVGMILAHQNLDQLSTGLRASVMSNTSIKIAGGVSAKDAKTFALEMRCEAEFVQNMRKRAEHTKFAAWIRNLTPQAIEVLVPLGQIDRLPTLEESDYETLIAANRTRYAVSLRDMPDQHEPRRPEPIVATPEPEKEVPPPEPEHTQEPTPRPKPAAKPATARPSSIDAPPRPLGRGGRQHKYLQQLVKQAAEERGYRATIEEPILDGAGSVDVSLSKGELRIACEISVTSTQDQELGNIEKCLAANYDQVILVSSHARHLNTLQKFITPNLEPEVSERVFFLLPEDMIAHLDVLDAGAQATEETVRGYTVKVTHQPVASEEAQARRQTIAGVIARSLNKLGDK